MTCFCIFIFSQLFRNYYATVEYTDPQMLIAEFNLIFGVVAIISAIPKGGGSLYFLAVADAAFGVGMVSVNIKKLNDLKNGNANTNPSILEMDQSMLDLLGIGLAVVSLASLMKHGFLHSRDV
jgi:hypothetical protein